MTTVGEIKAIIADVASHAGIPAWIMLDVAERESGFDNRALGDNGQSYGLFQLYTNGGLGAGFTQDQLFDPRFNAQVAAAAMAPKYITGRSQGLNGEALLLYVANSSGWPANGGTVWVDTHAPTYNPVLKAVYHKNIGDSYHIGSGTGGGSTSTSLDDLINGIKSKTQGMGQEDLTKYAVIGVGAVALMALLS